MNFIYTFVALILVSVLQAQRCDVIHGGVEQVDRQISTFSQPRHGNISIPVIFHIVYRNSDQNISDAQILAQLDILNSIYDPHRFLTIQVCQKNLEMLSIFLKFIFA
ncbi:MAG: hypothetical protein IPJ43_18935 [Saprospiraceae bacterium]|nr:hypothetical protein [Saprospiraceae bacterium]